MAVPMPRGRPLRLLLRWCALGIGIMIALRALWGAWDLPGEQYWHIVGVTFAGLGALVLTAAVPGTLLVLLRRSRRPRGAAGDDAVVPAADAAGGHQGDPASR